MLLVLTTATWREDEYPTAGDTVGIVEGDDDDDGCVLLVLAGDGAVRAVIVVAF